MKIEIQGLEKKIKGNLVLKDINLELTGGTIYGLQGKNGCGKTMLMRTIAGLILPTKGRVVINGKELHKDISIPESIGILIENPSFLADYSGFDNLKMLAMLQGNVSDEEIKELLVQVGLESAGKKKYGKYSLGMKQRLGVAAAIMGKPEIILLDEPINAIDGEGVEEIRKVIRSLCSDERIIIVACHDKEEMALLADEIIQMREGVIISEEIRREGE
ncbi:MAG: ATP-binding cassette domain-containing protein [Butyribacter sp.]|nr:ATP-binding cassette domain-containing protein [bacterium]MDY3854572.1 ATP-binding cassette domain-containing protein [Butyribacter sp.]